MFVCDCVRLLSIVFDCDRSSLLLCGVVVECVVLFVFECFKPCLLVLVHVFSIGFVCVCFFVVMYVCLVLFVCACCCYVQCV